MSVAVALTVNGHPRASFSEGSLPAGRVARSRPLWAGSGILLRLPGTAAQGRTCQYIRAIFRVHGSLRSRRSDPSSKCRIFLESLLQLHSLVPAALKTSPPGWDATDSRIDPSNFEHLRDHRRRSGRKTLDQLAQSDDPGGRAQVTGAMSAWLQSVWGIIQTKKSLRRLRPNCGKSSDLE
jgi:hypothetical protein